MVSRKLSIALAMTFCIFFGASISASAADFRCFVFYEWKANALEQFTMDITMTGTFTGTVETNDGLTGNLFTILVFVVWDLERITFYRGFIYGPLALGDMENVDQQKGNWFALITPLGAAADNGVMLGKP